MREDRASAATGAAPSSSSSSRIPRPTTSADGPDADLLAAPSAKASCLFPPGEGGDCLERDDSSVGCQRDHDDGGGGGSTFFDSLSRQWVRVDNFAFAQSDNHFSSRDSGGAEEEEEEGTGSLLDRQTLAAADNALSVSKDEEEELEHMFEQVRVSTEREERRPKIVLSPREGPGQVSRPLRDKLALDDGGRGLMPSRSNPGTPRSSLGSSSGIPRFVRNPKARPLANGAVHRRVMQKQAGSLEAAGASSDFSRDKSRSSSSLSAIRMKGGGGAARKNSRSDTSINLVGCSRRGREYGHVKSKVREYIDEVKRLSASRKGNGGGGSFQLSPGRKSLGMSNLAAEEEGSTHRQPSSSNLSRMKAFISTSHLEDLRITLRRKQAEFGGGEEEDEEGVSADASAASFDRARLARLLDDLSDESEDREQGEDLSLGVEDVLLMAWTERREKQEAKKVLSQLQENYDVLQRRFADAENRIDKLRFSRGAESGEQTIPDSAITDLDSRDSSFLVSPAAAAAAAGAASVCSQPSLKRGCPNRRDPSAASAFMQEATKNLREIEDQMYGMELLSDISSSGHRKAILEMRKAFETLSKQSRNSSSVHYDELVQEIGLKLRQLELKSGTAAQRKEGTAPSTAHAATAAAGLDPITKVSNWRQANPSCYGSGSVDADSSAPTKTHNGDEDSSDCSPPGGGGGFDSGYPGSDRSGVNKTGRSGSLGFGGGSGRRTILGNVLEEEVSARSESSIPSEYATKPPPPNIGVFHIVAPEDDDGNQIVEEAVNDSLLQPPPAGRQHLRGVLHSITDLSSDERSMFDRSDRSVRSAAGLSSPHISRNRPPASSTPRSAGQPPPPPPSSSALTTGRQPAVLAEQIDKEIVELRNFFDDHREEMMSLIKENSQELFPKDPAAARHVNPRVESQIHKLSLERRGSCESSTDAEYERRRMEFAKRRIQKTRKKQHLIQRLNSGGGVEDKLDYLGKAEPKFVLGPVTAADSLANNCGISSFFPPVSEYGGGGERNDVVDCRARAPFALRNEFSAEMQIQGGGGGGGRLVEAGDGGQVFVPKLNLDNLSTDASIANAAVRDPRSFDFHQSWPEYDNEDASAAVDLVQQPQPPWQVHDPKASMSSPAPLPPPPPPAPAELLSNPLAHLATAGHNLATPGHAAPPPPPPPAAQVVVVHSACCRHSGSSERAADSSSGGARSRADVKSKRKSSKVKKELKALLATLEAANQTANKLRDRSQGILQVLECELSGAGASKSQ